MIKALLKKELLSVLAFFMQGKDGKRRSKWATIGFFALMIYGFGASGVMFWLIAETLCEPLATAGLAWVYFAFMSVFATALGIIGGVFMAKAKLYEAKDNDVLLSMPIPAWAILLVRLTWLYLFTFLFEMLVFVPSLVQYYICVGVSALSLLFGVLILLIMPLGAVAVCCLLGFVVAWCTARMPFKNLFSIVGTLAFLVVYFVVYSKINEYLTYVLMNGAAVGSAMQNALFPFAKIGEAATGNVTSFLWFVLIFGSLFALTYFVLSKTYLHVVTTKKGERYAKYKEKKMRSVSPQIALFKREFFRLIKSPVYLLNASMGTLIMLIMGVMVVIYGDFFGIPKEMLIGMGDKLTLLLSAVVCFLASSNTIAACSISLEGETLWLARSLPVPSWSILKAKLYLHIVMTFFPAVLCGVTLGVVAEVSEFAYVGVLLTAAVASVAFAAMDLAINLKLPNLRWTSEMAAVKQSMSTVVAMFGGWGVALLFVGGYFLFGKYLPVWGYLTLCLAMLAAATIAFILWLKGKGTITFESL